MIVLEKFVCRGFFRYHSLQILCSSFFFLRGILCEFLVGFLDYVGRVESEDQTGR